MNVHEIFDKRFAFLKANNQLEFGVNMNPEEMKLFFHGRLLAPPPAVHIR